MPHQSTQPRTFHPQFVENVAAEVFWGYAFRTDHDTAAGAVLDRDFEKLWSLKKATELVRRYAAGLSKSDVSRLYDEVNGFMLHKVGRVENILGTLYVEDFAACRPPAFPHGDLLRRLREEGADDNVNRVLGATLPVAGDLLLRTPLPAAVLLKAPASPEIAFIRVGDTRKALGFQKTMVLLIRTLGELPPNPQGYTHAAHGFFQIPCPEDAPAAVWFKLIPNSTVCREAKFV